jgi:hypothetical protein
MQYPQQPNGFSNQMYSQNQQFPPNQIYPPAQLDQGMNPQQQQIDLTLAGGFGDMFFNMNDPNIAKTNVPIKQDASMHTATIISTVLMIGGIVAGAIGFRNFLPDYGAGLLIGLPYLVYLSAVICCSDIRGYITNLKKF